jgi:hypothetical protein
LVYPVGGEPGAQATDPALRRSAQRRAIQLLRRGQEPFRYAQRAVAQSLPDSGHGSKRRRRLMEQSACLRQPVHSRRTLFRSLDWVGAGWIVSVPCNSGAAGPALLLEPRRVRTQDKACSIGLMRGGVKPVARGSGAVAPPASASPTQVERALPFFSRFNWLDTL